jgi:O-antigen/teichoic acid export membrane protein
MSVSKHTAYNLAGAIIPLVLSFVTVPLYLHLVGADRFGVLSIAWLLLGYFGLFDLGLGKATSFRMASLNKAEPAKRADVFRTALLINVGIGVLGGFVLWAAGWWFFGSIFKVSPELRAETLAGLPWLAASVPVATMTGVLTGALQGREKFLETNMVSVISTVLFQLFPIAIAWQYGPHLAGLLAAAVTARVAAILVLWWRCHKEFTHGQNARWKREEAKELLSFGGWVSFNGFMGPMLIMADRFFIGASLGARAVAIYTIPFQLAQRSSVIPNALTGALFPRMTAVSPAERRMILDKSIRTLAAILTVPVYLALFMFEPFLRLWVGAELAAQAHRIGIIIIVAFWANAFIAIYYTYFQAAGRPATVAKLLMIQVVPYLALLWPILQTWGLEGAAWLFAARTFATFLPIFGVMKPTVETVRLIAMALVSLLLGLGTVFLVQGWGSGKLVGVGAVFTGLAVASAIALRRDFPSIFSRLRLVRM